MSRETAAFGVAIDRDTDSLVVYTGKEEVGRYCIVDDAEAERESLEAMIQACVIAVITAWLKPAEEK